MASTNSKLSTSESDVTDDETSTYVSDDVTTADDSDQTTTQVVYLDSHVTDLCDIHETEVKTDDNETEIIDLDIESHVTNDCSSVVDEPSSSTSHLATTDLLPSADLVEVCPSVAKQRLIVSTISTTDNSTHLYAVSKSWWKRWKDHVTENQPSVKNIQGQGHALGPVDMDLRHAGSADSNEYVPETLWCHLVNWFGVSANHQLDRRHKAPSFNDEILFEICTLSPYSGIVDHVNKTFNRFEEVGFVEFQLRRLFSVPLTSNTRLWISECERLPPNFRFLCNRNRMLNDSLERDRKYILALEVRAAGSERWPTGEPGEAKGELEKYFSLLRNDKTKERPWIDNMEQVACDVINVSTRALERLVEELTENGKAQLKELESHVTQLNERVSAKRSEVEHQERKLEERKEKVAAAVEQLHKDRRDVEQRLAQLTSRDARWKAEQLVVEEVHHRQQTRIKLDVGGTVFMTSRRTLVDRDRKSLLAAMFPDSPSDVGLKPEVDGSYFIDRDGAHFHHVIAYLRNGSNSLLPAEVGTLRHVLCEAKFYKLREFVRLIEDKLTQLNASIL